jgi:hypothetical protein
MSIHAPLKQEALEQLHKQRRNTTISSFVISILAVVLIALILGIFLLPNILKEVPVIVTYASSLEEQKEVQEKKVTTKVMRKPSSPSSSMAKVIAANTQSPTAVPVPDQIADTPSLDFGDGDDFGSGWGDGNGTSGGGGTLFGRQVKSSNLGVVLDVSGSAHAYLAEAIHEIEKSFPTAHIVLVVGCGMSGGNLSVSGGGKVPGKPRIVEYRKMDSEKKYNSLPRSAPAQLEQFYKKIGSKRGKEMKDLFKKRNNLYLLYGGDIMATQYAFEYVLDRKVDTIYWFADFADKTDPGVIDKLTKKLRFNQVTLISHNFLGKPVGKLAKEMTLKTGGSVIEMVPGKKK